MYLRVRNGITQVFKCLFTFPRLAFIMSQYLDPVIAFFGPGESMLNAKDSAELYRIPPFPLDRFGTINQSVISMRKQSFDRKQWLLIDRQYPTFLQAKHKLFNERHDEIVNCQSGSRTALACQEAAQMVTDYLVTNFPMCFKKDGDSVTNLVSGQIFSLKDTDMNPLEIACRLAKEDFIIMMKDEKQGSGAEYQLQVSRDLVRIMFNISRAAVASCFPAGAALTKMIGFTLTELHRNLHGWQKALSLAVDRYNHPISSFGDAYISLEPSVDSQTHRQIQQRRNIVYHNHSHA
jgi:Protein of unknown function (DUF3445)